MTRRLAEVALRAEVSQATVSRVLNNKPGVSEATRQRVLTSLDVLGYERPSKLRGERAPLVGLVLPELQNPIFPAFADVLGSNLAQLGLIPVLCTQTAGGVPESEYVDLLLEQHVSGVVFAGGNYNQGDADHEHYARLIHRKLPVVLINAAIDHLPFPRVVCDDVSAMQQSMEHLISLGHERIGLVLGPQDHVPSERKLQAARQVSERAGIHFDEELVVRSLYSLQSGQASAARLIERGVTGIICASDPLALGAVRAVRRAGLSCPEDISVIGYDDSALMACVEPPLTTVRQPIEAMGRAAVAFLVSQIEGSMGPVDELLFEPELVVRRSTGPAKKR